MRPGPRTRSHLRMRLAIQVSLHARGRRATASRTTPVDGTSRKNPPKRVRRFTAHRQCQSRCVEPSGEEDAVQRLPWSQGCEVCHGENWASRNGRAEESWSFSRFGENTLTYGAASET